jgi:hypothetical protein
MARTIIHISKRNAVGVWVTFSILFLYWVLLFLTSDLPPVQLFELILLFALFCFALPAMGSFCIYVTVDETHLTVPMAAVLRRSIPIEDIQELTLRRHGLGFLKGIIVDYLDDQKRMRSARLPSFSTFGRSKTKEMVQLISRANPAIRIDPKIRRALLTVQ